MLDTPTPPPPPRQQIAERPARRPGSWVLGPWVLALVVLAGGAAWFLWPHGTPAPSAAPSASAPPPALTVATVPVRREPLARTVFGDGTVVPWQELVLSSDVGGLRIAEVLVDEGDTVRAGQVLVRMEETLPAAQLAQAQAAVQEAQAALEIARADLARAAELSRTQNTPRQVLDQRQAAAKQAEARLASAQATRDDAQARLRQATLRAPYDGVVLKRSVLPGAVSGMGQEMIRLLRDGRLELNARVPELDLAAVTPDQPAVVRHGTRRIAASVRAIAPLVAAETRLGTVHIALPADSGLRAGMFARAEIGGAAVPALVIPQEAVVYRDGTPVAFVRQGERVAMRRLTTGLRQGGKIEILEGLAEGEAVVRTGAGFLSDGDIIRIAPEG